MRFSEGEMYQLEGKCEGIFEEEAALFAFEVLTK